MNEEPSLAWSRIIPDLNGTETGSPSLGSTDLRDGSVYLVRDPRLLLALDVALASGRPSCCVASPAPASPRWLPGWRVGWAGAILNMLSALAPRRRICSGVLMPCAAWPMRKLRAWRGLGAESELAERGYIEPGPLWWAFDRASALRLSPTIREPDLPWARRSRMCQK